MTVEGRRSGAVQRVDAVAGGRARGASAASGRHVVVAAPTRGDAGSTAVIEALLELGADDFDLVLGVQASPRLEPPRGSTLRTLPGLLAGTRYDRHAAVLRAAALVGGAARCSVIAPDTIADRDDAQAFVRCIALARAAAEAGSDTRVIGLAWNLGGGGVGVLALQAAVRAGVQLYVRDDFSLMRAMNEGLVGLHRSADLALAAEAVDGGILVEAGVGDGPFALLTVCAGVLPGADPAAEYVAVAEHLLRRGLRLLLLPSACSGYDLLLLGRVARALAGDVTVLRRPLSAAELRSLAAASALVVTDRTRTAAVALSAGAAVLGLSTRRELEVLLRSASLGGYSVLPKPGFAAQVERLADELLAQEGLPCDVRRAVAELSSLARTSLTGVPLTEPGLQGRATG